MQIHNVFYILLLKLAPLGAPKVLTIETYVNNLNATYNIERILDCRIHRGKKQYLVKWLDYLDIENT